MPDEFEVDSVLTSGTYLPGHEHITFIGNNSGQWKISRASAVRRIEGGQQKFYTLDPRGRRVYLHVIEPYGRPAYVQTKADGVWSDNLLSLPPCSPACVDQG